MACDDYYKRLGVSRSASGDSIKSSFRSLAKRVHPDLHPGDPTAENAFKLLNEAYIVLSDVSERRKYDALNLTAGLRPTSSGSVGEKFSFRDARATSEAAGPDSWGDFLRDEADRNKAAERLRSAACRGQEWGGGQASHFDGWEARRAARVAAAEAAAATEAATRGLSETGHYRAYAGQWRSTNRQGGGSFWAVIGFLALSSAAFALTSSGTLMSLKRGKY